MENLREVPALTRAQAEYHVEGMRGHSQGRGPHEGTTAEAAGGGVMHVPRWQPGHKHAKDTTAALTTATLAEQAAAM
jgi:hypothetical protein